MLYHEPSPTAAAWLAAYEKAQSYDFIVLGSNSGINDWDQANLAGREASRHRNRHQSSMGDLDQPAAPEQCNIELHDLPEENVFTVDGGELVVSAQSPVQRSLILMMVLLVASGLGLLAYLVLGTRKRGVDAS